MKKKAFKQQKSRVVPLFSKWAGRLGLQNYLITVTYYSKKKDFRKESKAPRTAVMSVTPDWRYLVADIRVCVPRLVDLSDEDIERCVIHELLHVVLNHVFGWKLKRGLDEISHEEHVVSHLTSVIYSLQKPVDKKHKT